MPERSAERRDSLEGRVALVTGCGRGVGRAAAHALAARGAAVVVTGRAAGLVHETERDIRAAGGVSLAVAGDSTEAAFVDRVVETTLRRFGRLDVLVNGAAYFDAIGPVWSVAPDVWWADLTANLRGVHLFTHAALRGLGMAERGRIVNVLTYAGPFSSSAAAARAATVALTDVWQTELAARDVSVFGLDGGMAQTRVWQSLDHSAAARRWLKPVLSGVREAGPPRTELVEAIVDIALGRRDDEGGTVVRPVASVRR